MPTKLKIANKAVWKGDCRAPSVAIEDGCVINGGYFEVPFHAAVAAVAAVVEAKPEPTG